MIKAIQHTLLKSLLAYLLIFGLAKASEMEETIVTAQKREQSLQEVGIAVTNFNAALLQQLEINNSVELARHTAGLMVGVPVGEGNNPNFTLRGVGINDYADANEGPVAVYVDGVYNATLAGLTFQLFDLERAEVLRGPQGTLFGRNATGGLIHYITRKPSHDFNAYTRLTVAQDQQLKVSAAIGGGISENSAVRLSVASIRRDGLVKNSLGQDGNDADNQAVRAQWLWTPGDAFNLRLNLQGNRSDTTGPRYAHRSSYLNTDLESQYLPSGSNLYGTCAGCDVHGYRDLDGNPFSVDQDHATGLRINSHGVIGIAEWQRGSLTLTSVTGYNEVNKTYDEEVDGGPYPAFWAEYHLDAEQFSQELRAQWEQKDALWTAGLYYFKHDLDGQQRAVASFNMGTWTSVLDSNPDWQQSTESRAIFGQAEIDLNDQWRLIAGLRYTDDEKDFEQLVVDPLVPPFNSDFRRGQAGFERYNDNYLSSKLELDWRPQEGSLVYASLSRGVKGGGFNTGFIFDLPNERIPYEKENLTSYEIGYKGSFLQERYTLNAALFYYDYEDFQAFQQVSANQYIFNADASHLGFDLELNGHPGDRFDFTLALSYLDAQAEDIGLPSGATTDRDMVFAPRLNINTRLRYTWPLRSGRVSLQGDLDYVSEHYFHIYNDATMRESSYLVGNLNLAYSSGDGQWEAMLWVKNIGDRQYRNYALDFTGFGGYILEMYAPERHIGATLTYHWN